MRNSLETIEGIELAFRKSGMEEGFIALSGAPNVSEAFDTAAAAPAPVSMGLTRGFSFSL